MPESLNQPIGREVFATQELVTAFPPKLRDRNKKLVYRIACPPGCTHQGRLICTRWQARPLPEPFPVGLPKTALESREDVFYYEPTPEGSRAVEWYVNFAHYDLFCAYGGAAFAQDEMQVAEHPALGSLREALLASPSLPPLTVESGQPTPILIRGVERRCVVATNPNEAEGRPHGLYGTIFSRAKAEVVERATRPIVPPTITNLIAMEAPSYGSGAYTATQIDYILRTAYTGFRAARIESSQPIETIQTEVSPDVVIHTGFWGCGAYGGNRILMALVQILAARLAEIDRLVFHTFDQAGSNALAAAEGMLERVWPTGNDPRDARGLIAGVQALGFQWGMSDGN
jgi:hypothetical protein